MTLFYNGKKKKNKKKNKIFKVFNWLVHTRNKNKTRIPTTRKAEDLNDILYFHLKEENRVWQIILKQ